MAPLFLKFQMNFLNDNQKSKHVKKFLDMKKGDVFRCPPLSPALILIATSSDSYLISNQLKTTRKEYKHLFFILNYLNN